MWWERTILGLSICSYTYVELQFPIIASLKECLWCFLEFCGEFRSLTCALMLARTWFAFVALACLLRIVLSHGCTFPILFGKWPIAPNRGAKFVCLGLELLDIRRVCDVVMHSFRGRDYIWGLRVVSSI